MHKMVFFDIDGTLLTARKKIPETAKQAIQDLKDNGIIPVIATGRPPFRIDAILEELNIQSYITMNGQYVVYENEVIYRNPMSSDSIERLAKAAEVYQQGIAFSGSEEILGNSLTTLGQQGLLKRLIQKSPIAPPKLVVAAISHFMGAFKTKKPVLPEYYENRPIYQCILHASEKFDAYYREEFPDCHFTRWNPYSVDVITKNHSKAVGIQKMTEHLGISLQETIAFGDGLNDIEMLQTVGIGVAMESGRREVCEIADFITVSPENDGILKGLQQLKVLP
ncbi:MULTISPECIES: Cof-type HAD-IIB family hydrolase [Carnobacterium]|uniref:Cof-type HAD-IIB family hydrolase n=3 Tax=Carnobacterium TaxID=2747 RepID=A0ABW4NJ72_9LACT|nr:Cof-type HAD-IIB family hydrolase [Carnobacterium sp. CP1]ALV22436.1 Hydrolase (HAD superfamily) [Carnobacterium sp. CP1]